MRHHPSNQNMAWTVLFSLLATLALNGCGDSNNVAGPPAPIPLSPDAKLSSLTVTFGQLQPAFSSDVAIYTVDVASTVANVTVTANPQNATATMTINGVPTNPNQGRLVLLGAPGKSTSILIVVTAQNGSQNTFIVTVDRLGANNANLSDLTVTSGTLSPGFTSPNIGPYTVDVANTVHSVTVTATKADVNATVFINGVAGTSRVINLPVAPSTTEVNVQVIAQDGTTTKTYVVNVNRLGANNANLFDLTVTSGTLSPGFTSPNIGPYTVDVANTVDSVTVTATKADANATVSINGVIGTSQVINLSAAPSNTQVDILVIAQDTVTTKTYTIMVNRP